MAKCETENLRPGDYAVIEGGEIGRIHSYQYIGGSRPSIVYSMSFWDTPEGNVVPGINESEIIGVVDAETAEADFARKQENAEKLEKLESLSNIIRGIRDLVEKADADGLLHVRDIEDVFEENGEPLREPQDPSEDEDEDG